MIIKLLIDGGDMKPGPAVAQKLGPIGINIGKVISEINRSTKEFKGMKVPVELDVNEKSKNFTVITFSPPTSELLKKELNLEKGTSDHKNVKIGNASIEDVIKIAKIKHPNMLEKDLKSAVKSVLGTCASIGILVENENANDTISVVNQGRFDKEINSESSETSSEKRKKLNEYFNKIKVAQDEKIAKEKAEEDKSSEEKKSPEKEGKKSIPPPEQKEEKGKKK